MGLILLVGRRVNNPTTLPDPRSHVWACHQRAGKPAYLYSSAPEKVKAYSIWSYGAFNGVTWDQLQVLLPVILLALGILAFLPKGLNALLLGEDYAKTMGLNVSRLRTLVLIGASILSGAITAFCGPIGFYWCGCATHRAQSVKNLQPQTAYPAAVILIGAIVAVARRSDRPNAWQSVCVAH